MPQVQIYLTEEEYGRALEEAHSRGIKVPALLVQTIREAMP